MIKENQRMLNYLNVLLDGLILFFAMPVSFVIRFFVLRGGVITVPFASYLWLAAILTPVYLFTFAAFSLYESFRKKRLYQELGRLFWACALDMVLLQTALFLAKGVHFSRGTLAIFFVLSFVGLSGKRYVLRTLLRYYRQRGFNQKHVVLVGDGVMAKRYLETVQSDRELGYLVDGYVANRASLHRIKYYGGIGALERVLERCQPDEVVGALSPEDFRYTPVLIEACEKAGVKLSIIPFYAEYMPSNPQFDDLDGIPLMNIRRIPLDNWVNAFLKRLLDVVGSLVLIILSSPLMLIAAVGVKLSSPGPVIFTQERIGRNKKPFRMYKFRSMRVNDRQETGWSRDRDDRKTKFGAFIRKCSIDELPQFFNVLKGDMSLVGPRPEVPYYVEQFKDEIPLYMVKHQVRPGITGWAQVNGLRGDTSIKARVEHDIFYIEHWTLGFDIRILFMTLFKALINSERLT